MEFRISSVHPGYKLDYCAAPYEIDKKYLDKLKNQGIKY